jgi:hypothetical protein
MRTVTGRTIDNPGLAWLARQLSWERRLDVLRTRFLLDEVPVSPAPVRDRAA